MIWNANNVDVMTCMQMCNLQIKYFPNKRHEK